MYHRLFLVLLLLLSCTWLSHASTVTVPPGYRAQYDHDTETIILVPINPEIYYSVGGADRDKVIIKKAIDEYRKGGGHVPVPTPPVPAEDEREKFRIIGRAQRSVKPAQPTPPVDLNASILAVVNTTCVKCHKPGAAKPGVQLLTEGREL